ncbi:MULTISPECIES: PAS domain-containing sensor histidine kinase [unclassified Rhizobium]|uniref:PAS domain-containing sensor histidine kinase n=1 Tax=unclassified Rhizobium TaxID=2613769 RepID=UPI001ADD44A8|nr:MULTISPECIES: PAS domain-containing sensor histidine kinase [unclassified Rhizobium]MBO9127856.1 PAS domain-containing sensor histidine kinase [Rhizobium sp. 16-488-2b]MBO9175144.1 PAS domain-containing sensor histidine kinase [Rhizobium sp. 16-488-2a]
MTAADTARPTPTEDLDDLYENAPCGYLSLQPDGRIVKVNRTLALWLDIPAEELLGKRLRDLLNMAGRIFYETHFAPLLRMQGFFNEVALDLITADGKKLPVLANALERRDDAGKLIFTRVTLFQAVERRRYERELVEARVASDAAGAAIKTELDTERQNSELREQFIAILGHDLRNPLASMSAAVRLLRKETLTPRGGGVLDLMQGSVSRMSGLIDNVLDFARVRLGSGLVLASQVQPLEPVVRQVLDELRAAHPERALETVFSIEDDIEFDASRIAQLVSNLVANALTHGKPDEPVRLSASVSDGHLELWIANSGVPIPADAQLSLFEPFFRGDRNGSQEGLGLGLHISSEIARAHGGVLSVTSDDTETRFTFTMPITREKPDISQDPGNE